MDYGVGQCIDRDDNQRCSASFLVTNDHCYEIEWSTECTSTYTTAEVRDAASAEILFQSDTKGQWRPEKVEVSSYQKTLQRLQLMIPSAACLCRLQAKGLPGRQ